MICLFLGCEKTIHVKPVYEGIEPTVAGTVGISESETMPTVLVKVKLNGATRLVPRIDHTKLTPEKEVVCSDDIEHGRSVLRHFNRAHAAIDRTDEVELHGL